MAMPNRARTRPYIVGIGGTMRTGSSSEKALRLSLASAQLQGAEVALLSGDDLDLPMFAPEARERPAKVIRLLGELRRCDGLILASPSYHGSISGLLKNALDYTEDLRSDARVYLAGLPVGLIACGAGWQGAASALSTLRVIVHALRGWPTPLGAALNTASSPFDQAGTCVDPSASFQLQTIGSQVVEFAQMARSHEPLLAVAETVC